ncbi:MAG: hypothetical protein IPF95_15595 [Flavobacteriales bacterium]|nr:hypothetical protein [Flavobacteriales bacterium]MBK6945428.1 hypothetical protein [Flavobacteriales bacterium]MBK9535015.1 hypothetical protein [Flavobacteriales bacterium]HQV51231.1 hypothetical protein [Flavobacteriales bacterium]HQX31277.1 hypothetical protein [Flavobacteriales bacterium]
MIVSSMSIPEMVTDARQDFRSLWNKIDGLLPKLRRMHLNDRAHTLDHLEPWKSPRKNNWLLHFSISKSGLTLHSLVWSYDAKGRIIALIVTKTGRTTYLDNHMIQRYGERFDPTSNPLERLQSFFYENYYHAIETLHESSPGIWEVRVGMNHGLGLGDWDQNTDIVHVRTFVSYGQLFPEQQELMERLDTQRAWDSLTTGQQTERLARAERVEEAEKQAA